MFINYKTQFLHVFFLIKGRNADQMTKSLNNAQFLRDCADFLYSLHTFF